MNRKNTHKYIIAKKMIARIGTLRDGELTLKIIQYTYIKLN